MVYNFHVEGLHCYAVGRGQVLAHNNSAGSTAPFLKYASADQSKGIYGALNSKKMIEFVIEAGPQADPRGHELFQQMVDHFGSQANGVVGSWTYGSNLAKFNELTANGMSLEQAAASTWTGTQAVSNGFTNVNVIEVKGSPGAFTKVLAEFTR
jgi:hypothetical protein